MEGMPTIPGKDTEIMNEGEIAIAKRKEEFGYCIERVINQAMRRMLEKDKE